jgi:hypothetical protein
VPVIACLLRGNIECCHFAATPLLQAGVLSSVGRQPRLATARVLDASVTGTLLMRSHLQGAQPEVRAHQRPPLRIRNSMRRRSSGSQVVPVLPVVRQLYLHLLCVSCAAPPMQVRLVFHRPLQMGCHLAGGSPPASGCDAVQLEVAILTASSSIQLRGAAGCSHAADSRCQDAVFDESVQPNRACPVAEFGYQQPVRPCRRSPEWTKQRVFQPDRHKRQGSTRCRKVSGETLRGPWSRCGCCGCGRRGPRRWRSCVTAAAPTGPPALARFCC